MSESANEPWATTTSESFNILSLLFYTDLLPLVEDHLVAVDLKTYVQSRQFDDECAKKAREGAQVTVSAGSDSDSSEDPPAGEPTSIVSSMGASPHDVPPLKANFYHVGLSPSPNSQAYSIRRPRTSLSSPPGLRPIGIP